MLKGVSAGAIKELHTALAKDQIAKGRAEQVDLTFKEKEVKTKKEKKK